MYQIKATCEDFKVFEKNSIKPLENGKYLLFELEKTDYTTQKALETLANTLKIPLKNITYAGNKDRIAITKQFCTVKNLTKDRLEKIELNRIKIKFLGYVNEPISLGNLDCNYFEIVIRNIDKKPKELKEMYNFFGEQRFSKNNAEVGKNIVKGNYKKACELLIGYQGEQEKKVKDFLDKHYNQYIDALKTIPFKILLLYIHSYQSYLWNKILSICIGKNIEVEKIPLIGFDYSCDDEELKHIIKEILKEEDMTPRDFIIREIPYLSPEGGVRDAKIQIKGLEIGELEDDDLNPGMKKVLFKFFLPKGSYATECIRQMFS